jgi:hypothetical protein
MYTIAWLLILYKIWYAWNVPIFYKLSVNLVLILGTPALSDLTKTYDKYKKDWETKNETT